MTPEAERLLHTFRGHRGAVFRVAFLSGGRCLISGSRDGTLKIREL